MASSKPNLEKGRRSFKVMMVAPTSFFKDYGGHIRILEETLALQDLGCQITIVTYYQGNDVNGLDIRRTRKLPWRADYEVGSSRHKLAFDFYLAASALRTGLSLRPDLVHGHMHEGALIGGMVARALGVPLVFDYQGGLSAEMVDHGFLNPGGRIFPWVRRLEGAICRMPDAILTSSHRARLHLTEQFGVRPDVIHPLPDCVDTERFDPGRFSEQGKAKLRQELAIPEGRQLVVYLGLLADYQGIPHLIEAVRHLKNVGEKVHFLIMGYPRVAHYRALAEQKSVSDSVTFTGKIGYVDAPRYLSLGDIAVSAKMSTTEGSGKVLNYMAMGQAIAAFDTPVHREYLEELAVYAQAGDAAALAAAISGLLADAPLRHRLGEQLRQRAIDHFSWRKAGTAIDQLYRTLTSRR